MTMNALLLALFALPLQDAGEVKLGHSAHGAAFDEGARQKPWKMEGVGEAHFPITTSVPEVQEWFDQGNALLHSFWYLEAERAFRWCLKLDPECAMAYWGLARAVSAGGVGGGSRSDRHSSILREAILRKHTVSERERMFIEAWEEAFLPEMSGAIELLDEKGRELRTNIADKLEEIVLAYPDDVEAKALLLMYSLYRSGRYGNELIAQEIFEANPEHPGAHHYRIHNWDGPEGAEALDSCAAYGRIAWSVGHANHMPGHIYSGIGMWHEAAIWMDSATRVEKTYMRDRMIFPIHDWNYAHNRNYLSFIQEQLGLAEKAIDGGLQLVAAPLDPEYNDADGGNYSVFRQGMRALVRGLVRFERWEELLDGETIPWRDTVADRVWRTYCEGLAHLELGREQEAIDKLVELKQLEDEAEGRTKRFLELQLKELRALVALSRGEDLKGITLLTEAADLWFERYPDENDPPSYPRFLTNVLAEVYLEQGSPALAVSSFERTLEIIPNEGFALAGMVQAHAALGDRDTAAHYYGRLLHVWSHADAGIRPLEAARALGLDAEPIDESAGPQRIYADVDLSHLGPEAWRPYPAPELDALDSKGERVTLADYRGQNVVLVFFLGEECAHCVDQLIAIDERADDFEEEDVAVLAISGDSPQQVAASERMGELGFRLISDIGFANAKRFHSFDDFEEIELHSTIFIDRDGLIRWSRTGGDPFMELDFLLGEIHRVNEMGDGVAAVEAGAGGAGG